jgi:hypothetical protein
MNEGVQILLERMKTNPEEFNLENGFNTSSKWGRLIADYHPEDLEMLKEAINKLHQQTFTEKVMKELMAPKEESDDLGKWFTQQASGTPSAGVRTSSTRSNTNTLQNNGYALTAGVNGQPTWVMPGTNSLSIGNQTLDEITLEHMKAHLKAVQQEKQKQHKTLYGKLKNYLDKDR